MKRAAIGALLAVAALVVGIAAWDTPHVTGGTVLAFVLAMAGLWIVSPLVDPDDPAIEVTRITLDEACRR